MQGSLKATFDKHQLARLLFDRYVPHLSGSLMAPALCRAGLPYGAGLWAATAA